MRFHACSPANARRIAPKINAYNCGRHQFMGAHRSSVGHKTCKWYGCMLTFFYATVVRIDSLSRKRFSVCHPLNARLSRNWANRASMCERLDALAQSSSEDGETPEGEIGLAHKNMMQRNDEHAIAREVINNIQNSWCTRIDCSSNEQCVKKAAQHVNRLGTGGEILPTKIASI